MSSDQTDETGNYRQIFKQYAKISSSSEKQEDKFSDHSIQEQMELFQMSEKLKSSFLRLSDDTLKRKIQGLQSVLKQVNGSKELSNFDRDKLKNEYSEAESVTKILLRAIFHRFG